MAVDHPRITRVRLRNYRSVESCDVALSDLTLLVGPNGSGKSNFLDAISFLREAGSESVRDAVRRRGGMRDVSFQGCGEFSIGLTLQMGDLAFRYDTTISTTTHDSPEIVEEYLVPEHGDGNLGFNRTSEADHREQAPRTDRLSYVDALVQGLGRSAPLQPRIFLAALLLGWVVFEPDAAVLRSPQDPDPDGELQADGLNAPFHYRRLAAEQSEAVQSYLRMIVPGLRSVAGVALPEPESLETVRFTVGGRDDADFVLPARAMSEGTLRAFTVLVALFSDPSEQHLPIGIEEPEASLHPAAARVLLDALKEASAERQVIASTHSPDLLDRSTVGADEILAVRYLRGRSYVGPLDEVGREALAEELYTAGELLRTDQLLPEAPGEKPLRFDA